MRSRSARLQREPQSQQSNCADCVLETPRINKYQETVIDKTRENDGGGCCCCCCCLALFWCYDLEQAAADHQTSDRSEEACNITRT